MKHRHLLLPLALLLCTSCGPKHEPATSGDSASTEDLSEPLPWDPSVRKGVLDNGLTWYVEPNNKPADRVELRLVVDAGSILEDPDQLGLAHFAEHMAFNGTEHFAGNDMIKYLESIGTQFGAHLNAHTGFDETVYKLTIPTDKPELVDQGFLVLRDWAGGLLFDPTEIEKERGVVLEEWRSRLGPRQRSWELTIPLTYGQTAYPERLPIGTKESLEGFEHDALRRFYRDWYRPDLMAVIVVGSVDPDLAEAKIAALFSDLPMPEAPRERTRIDIPAHEDTQVVVFRDPELTRASVMIGAKKDRVNGLDHRAYRERMVEGLALAMLQERLSDRSREASPPFLGAGAGVQQTTPTEGMDTLGASVRAGGIRAGLEGMVTELERARQHGFTEGELARARVRRLKSMERSLVEQPKTSSRQKISELIRNFTKNESVPGLAYEVELHRRWLPEITAAEASAFISTWLSDDSRVIVAMEPEVPGLDAVTAEELVALVDEIALRELEPIAEEVDTGPLVTDLPPAGSIVSEEKIDELDVTVWTLSNGATVYWKATDFQEDKMLLAGTSPGGQSTADDPDWVAARTASGIRGPSGLGNFDGSALSKRLAGSGASASASSGTYFERISGRTDSESLTTLFELLWLQFTAPRFDEDAMAGAKQRREAKLENRLQSPSVVFGDRFNAVYWQDHPRHQPWTPETLKQMDLKKSEAFHRARFADASDFSFVFVGSIDPDALRDHVTRFIAPLPAASTNETWTDRGARPLTGKHQETVHVGSDPKGRFKLRMHGPYEDSYGERKLIRSLAAILGVRLREELREDLGGVYGVRVSPSMRHTPYEYAAITIQFGCDPERVPELERRTMEVLQAFIEAPVEASYVAQQQEKLRRQLEKNTRSNSSWKSGLINAIQRGEDPRQRLESAAWIESLTPEAVHAAAKRYLGAENQLKFIMLPEQSKSDAPVDP